MARFQQKQLQEKEEKLLRLYEEQQKRALKSVGSRSGGTSVSPASSVGVGKVRYLFQSRRNTEGKNGIGITGRDKSYPLEPLTKYPSARNLERDGRHRTARRTGASNWTSGPHQRSYSLDRYNTNLSGRNEYPYDLNGNEDYDYVDRYVTGDGRNIAGIRREKPNLVFSGRSQPDLNFYEVPNLQERSAFSKARNANYEREERNDTYLTQYSVKPSARWESDQNRNQDYGIQTNSFGGDRMEGRFRNFVSQGTANRSVGQQGPRTRTLASARQDVKETTSTNAINGNVSSPVRKIRKPTPVPLSVAPTNLFQREIKRTPRTETIKEVPMPVSSTRTSASRTQAGSSAKPLTSTVRNLPPTPQRSSPISKATASSQAVTTKSSLPSNLVDCRICGRHFAADRVAKHEEVCQKSSKKRKPFDALQQRVKGTEVEKYVRKSSKTLRSQPEQVAKPQSNWRKKHEEFIRNIRAAKEVSVHLKNGGKLSDLPPPPPSDYSDYIQCPHCSRKFNSSAAERHIPKCANIINNKPKPGLQKSGGLKQGTKLLRTASVSSPPAVRGRK
ncbi:hypothetical protein RUM43_007987 [Polyplax serrata]|uniref:C2HC/C3H-type domain-containing protein n=1 Tax=Polyplax serrata TaxID=468196 RepID=A0AAN8PY97_POLSC